MSSHFVTTKIGIIYQLRKGPHDNALEQANLIIRYFLDSGNIWVAEKIPDDLPEELASIDKLEDIATKYMHYRQLIHVWDIRQDCGGYRYRGRR
jgi:hypothetical protein